MGGDGVRRPARRDVARLITRAPVSSVKPAQCVAADSPCRGTDDCTAKPTADLRPVAARSADEHARLVLTQYACIACHRIPGIVGPEVNVGPPLEDLARRAFLPGGLPLDEENLVAWIRDPRRVDPGTAMPDMGVTEAHARLMAEYLLRPR